MCLCVPIEQVTVAVTIKQVIQRCPLRMPCEAQILWLWFPMTLSSPLKNPSDKHAKNFLPNTFQFIIHLSCIPSAVRSNADTILKWTAEGRGVCENMQITVNVSISTSATIPLIRENWILLSVCVVNRFPDDATSNSYPEAYQNPRSFQWVFKILKVCPGTSSTTTGSPL